MQYSKMYCGVVFHGANVGADEIGTLYQQFVQWQSETNGPPSHAAIEGKGFSGKVVGFKRQHDRLLRSGFAGVKSFDLYTPLPEAEYPNAEWSMYSHISSRPDRKRIIVCASTSLVEFDVKGPFAELVQTVVDLGDPAYGYGFYRDRGRGGGAEFYAIGLPTYISDPTPEEEEEQLSIQWWGACIEQHRLYEKGILRDVYPWNFLNHQQLARQIKGNSLEEWISDDACRGKLHTINSHLTLWTLSDEEIATVRPLLWDAGFLFHWREYQ